MNTLYSRIPSAAVFTLHDGRQYARIPHTFDSATMRVTEDFSAPRMLPAHAAIYEGGEALIPFGRFGDALSVRGFVPFGVTIRHTQN